jgi:photosystem II stability/assembly factor-like uncharacterized protein
MIRNVAVLLIISQSVVAQTGWEPRISGTTRNLRAVSFVTKSTAVVVGDSSSILRTTDHGARWAAVPVNGVYSFRALSFIGSDSGFLASATPHSAVLRTTDGGTTWDTVVAGIGGRAIAFANALTGHVCEGWDMYRTTDAGRNWARYDFPMNRIPTFEGVKMFDDDTGIAVGTLARIDITPFDYTSSEIFRTTDAGMFWGSVFSVGSPADLYTKSFYAVTFDGQDKGIAVGDSGLIVASTDGGVHWTERTSGVRMRLYGVAYRSGMATAVGDSGTILHSSDDGISWQVQWSGVSEPLCGVSFADSLTGIVVGARGTILQTTSGGVDGVSPKEPQVPGAFCLFQSYPNPFNPRATIEYALPGRSSVTIVVFNALGQQVAQLVQSDEEAGYHKATFDASGLSSGVYFYRLTARCLTSDFRWDSRGEAGEFTDTKKLVLTK